MLKTVYLLNFSVFFLLQSTNAAIGPVANLVLTNAVISPDGFSRSAILPGGTFPGSVIRGNKGDRFQINVIDNLTDASMLRSTSIHWHGIFQQNGSNWADGAAFVTQCPIAANDSFLYDFQTANQAGTYWYHSHLSTQYCDGLRGAFILYDPSDPHLSLYDIDDESTIITLADWYHVYARNVSSGSSPTSDATLINGRGRYPHGPAVPLSVISVQSGKRYRFRVIAMSCGPSFVFSIDGHNLTIIEADGENTSQLVVDSFQIFAGQRYSAVLAANQPVGNYWIRANPDEKGTPGFDGGRNSAILRYVGALAIDPTTSQTPNISPLAETDLHPLTNPAAPGSPVVGGADVVLTMSLSWDWRSSTFQINGIPFIPPTAPVLLQILSGAKAAQDLLPAGSLYSLPPNKVVEITIPGFWREGPHPFHLHGHSFSVIRSANSSGYNFANPVRRDTVSTGSRESNVTIRFATDNVGPWFLHCHIDWHLDIGMAVVMVEDFSNTPARVLVPTAWSGLCPRYNSLTPGQL